MTPFVCYYRVSTKEQGESGLGLKAQEEAVSRLSGNIIASYTEVESGRNNSRPKLHQALLHAKQSGATLVVAKLDRLGRNAAFLLTLMEGQVPIICADNPTDNQLTIGVRAIIAQHEAKMISQRTIEGLAAAKKNGVKLGSHNEKWQAKVSNEVRKAGLVKATKKSAEVRARLAQEAREEICPIIERLKAEGLTLQQIADRLNQEGRRTRRGRPWTVQLVCSYLKKDTR